jgi:hypothetical protein
MKHGVYLAELMIFHKKKPSSIDAKFADKSIKLCPECKRCWQLILSGWKGSMGILPNYYYDFPSYGKEKKICKQCEEKTK